MGSDELDELGEVTVGEDGEVGHQVGDGVRLVTVEDAGLASPDSLLTLYKLNRTMLVSNGRSINETLRHNW